LYLGLRGTSISARSTILNTGVYYASGYTFPLRI
jgi:hypothetical protein